MSRTTQHTLRELQIPVEKKARRGTGLGLVIILLVILFVAAFIMYSMTRNKGSESAELIEAQSSQSLPSDNPTVDSTKASEVVLTVSGYVIPRERIEISPKFQGTVKWIAVKKGDRVHKGDVIVQLVDDEYQARVLEAEGRLSLAEANLTNAEANLKRQVKLALDNVESERALDEAQRARDASLAEIQIAKGQLNLAQTYLDWCTIRAPIDGIVLEKLVDPNELVVPQSFGGGRGPSTAFVSLADLSDLQVEVDLNEADTPKVALQQRCKISPEAYPDKIYDGYVAEIAPEANRQKGTLQVKVQIKHPDEFLTPELTAKVEFLAN